MAIDLIEMAQTMEDVLKDAVGAGRVEEATARRRPAIATVTVSPTRSEDLEVDVRAEQQMRDLIELRATEFRGQERPLLLAVESIDVGTLDEFEDEFETFVRDRARILQTLKERMRVDHDAVARQILETDRSSREVMEQTIDEQMGQPDPSNLGRIIETIERHVARNRPDFGLAGEAQVTTVSSAELMVDTVDGDEFIVFAELRDGEVEIFATSGTMSTDRNALVDLDAAEQEIRDAADRVLDSLLEGE